MKPRLAKRARLRWDAGENAFMLVAPERGLLLDSHAVAITRLCDGTRTIPEIAALLAGEYAGDGEVIERDIEAFLGELAIRGLVRVEP